MTCSASRRMFDVQVWFEDGSRITVYNIQGSGHNWDGFNAKTTAEREAGSRRYADRGGIHAVAIQREHTSPCNVHGVSCRG